MQLSMATMETMAVVGLRSGIMMCITVCLALAPSTVEAYMIESWIFAMPESMMIEKYPMYFQKYMIAVDI